MIICEIGLNHMGDQERAIQMIEKILDSDADAISFQIRESKFYINNPEYLLPESFYEYAKNIINSGGKHFGLSVCDSGYKDYVSSISADFYKVLSWAIGDFKLVKELTSVDDSCTYLSTGMSNYEELDELMEEYQTIKEKISLIHTQLRFDIDDVNLSALQKMKSKYSVPISYGHHCKDMSVLYLSTAFLPDNIFFYVKLNDGVKNPDDKHAVNLSEIDKVISRVKTLPRAIGNSDKIKMKNQVESV